MTEDPKKHPPEAPIPEDLPLYLLVEDRPVCIAEGEDGVEVRAWSFDQGKVVPDPALFSLLQDYDSRADDVREIDEAEYRSRIQALQAGEQG